MSATEPTADLVTVLELAGERHEHLARADALADQIGEAIMRHELAIGACTRLHIAADATGILRSDLARHVDHAYRDNHRERPRELADSVLDREQWDAARQHRS